MLRDNEAKLDTKYRNKQILINNLIKKMETIIVEIVKYTYIDKFFLWLGVNEKLSALSFRPQGEIA